MNALSEKILSIFAAEESRRATAAHLIDMLDREGMEFTLDEFDEAISELRQAGEIRVKNPQAPIYDRVILRKF